MLRSIFISASVVALLLGAAACRTSPPGPRRALEDQPVPPRSALPSEPALNKAAQAHAHYAAAVVHEMNDETEAALEDYFEAATLDSGNESLMLEVSRRFIQARQFDKALELLKLATARPDASGAIYARLGVVYSQLGKAAEAVEANRVAVKRSPESIAGYHNLFLTFLQEKREDDAWGVLDQASHQSRADAEFLVGLSELYVNFAIQAPARREAAYSQAREALRRADKLNPASPMLRLRLADGLNARGDTARAAHLYLELLKRLPDAPLVRERVHARLAEIYLRGSDRKGAIEQLKAILRDDPTNPQACYYLGSLAFEDKDAATAVEYFRKAVVLSPDFEQAYYELALAQLSLDQASAALETLDAARKKFPRGFVLEMLTGMALGRQKAYGQALGHYTAAEVIAKATEPSRLNREFYFQLGSAYERTGDYAQAEKYFEKCLEVSPDFDEAMNYLGYMWAEHGLKLDRALELIEKAVKAEPENPAYLDSLGWVLFKLNRPEEALPKILKAIELNREPDATLYDHLGDVYATLNQPDKAREAWQKSLSIENSDLVKKKLEPGEGKKP